MSERNTYLAQQAAVYESPLAFTESSGAADVATANTTMGANIDSIIDLISLEGADPEVKRLFLDEMSPQARISLYKILTDLKASTVA